MGFTDIEVEMYQKIISAVNNRRNNKITSEFSIPELFTLIEWKQYPNPSILKVGKRFKKKIDANEINNVVYCHQNDKDWAVYKIIF
jgi:hypothetical protein